MPRPPRSSPHSPKKSRKPELEQPGSSYKQLPENPAPLSDDSVEAAKKRDAESATGAGGDNTPAPSGPAEDRNPGSGGDPAVESGRDENDPERPEDDLGRRPM